MSILLILSNILMALNYYTECYTGGPLDMMVKRKGKFFFNLFGASIVAVWLVMISALVRELHFTETSAQGGALQLAKSIDSPRREWKEIYLKEKKVGYAVNLIKPLDEGYFVQEKIFLKLNLMGLPTGVQTLTQCRLDDAFLLQSFHFKMSSGAVQFEVSGRVVGDQLVVERGRGKDRKSWKIRLSSPPMIGPGMAYFFESREIEVGETFKVPIFDPSTMAQKEIVIKVAARESIEINRLTYDAFRLETEMWGKRMTFWLDETGMTLKEEGLMGLSTVKSSAARAPRDIEGHGEIDFYEMVAVAVDRNLPDSARLSYLKLKVDGIDHIEIDLGLWSRGRQNYDAGVMEIQREKPPFRVSYIAPFKDYGGEMGAFLKPEFNIESDDEKIIAKAKEISGTNKNPIAMAGKLMNWVYHNLEKRPVAAVPSATEVLRTLVGDCNEHATLLTALLRASEIPARLSTGLVYTRGKFFYHAWTEAYTGQWISLDPTLNQMPVDATHIKLIEGNLDKQVAIAGLIGSLKLKVLDYDYD